jgi:hypothetical protein
VTTTFKLLTSPYQRSIDAMFTSALNEKVLVFAYPTSSNRVFTTWFCPFSGRLGRFSLIAKMVRMHQHEENCVWKNMSARWNSIIS